jgi:hypothetical protein
MALARSRANANRWSSGCCAGMRTVPLGVLTVAERRSARVGLDPRLLEGAAGGKGSRETMLKDGVLVDPPDAGVWNKYWPGKILTVDPLKQLRVWTKRMRDA